MTPAERFRNAADHARGYVIFFATFAASASVFVTNAAAAAGLAFASLVTLTTLFSLSAVGYLNLARDLAELTELTATASTAATGSHQVSPRPEWGVYRRLIMAATRVLPATHRPRYREEFRSELWDMGDLPRRYRLAYALRVVSRCWSLRRSLPDPAPEVLTRSGNR